MKEQEGQKGVASRNVQKMLEMSREGVEQIEKTQRKRKTQNNTITSVLRAVFFKTAAKLIKRALEA